MKIITVGGHRAAFTGRPAGMTGIAAVLNEMDMELIIIVFGDDGFHHRMGIIG